MTKDKRQRQRQKIKGKAKDKDKGKDKDKRQNINEKKTRANHDKTNLVFSSRIMELNKNKRQILKRHTTKVKYKRQKT